MPLRPGELAGTGESRSVLLAWLNEVVDYSPTDPVAQARRLFRLAFAGLAPQR